MTKAKKRKIIIIVSIAVLIILAILLIKGCDTVPAEIIGSINNDNTDVPTGGGGVTAPTTTSSDETTADDGDALWVSIFEWWQSIQPQCSRDSDCESICANPTYARCVDGDCSCAMPSTPTEPESTEPQCSRDSDCDYLCAAANAGVCNSGICGCETPTVDTDTCVDSDFGRASVFEVKGTCTPDLTSRGYTDYCSGGMLVEYSCRNGDTCSSQTVDCSTLFGRDSFCYDGMCTELA